MKEFQTPEGVQMRLDLFTLGNNFRVFPEGKQKRYSTDQLEGLNVSLKDWFDLLYSGDEVIPEEALFLAGRIKDGIFSKSAS
jgi:hypothetical protein